MRDGFKGPIYCSEATADLCAILLPDSGHIQEGDGLPPTAMAMRGIRRAAALPEADAGAALNFFKPVGLDSRITWPMS